MTEYYDIRLAGLDRRLPVVQISEWNKVALFQMLGDVELCEAVARELIKKAKSTCDYIVTPELKSVPLAHEMSRIINKPYIVARKHRKSYMSSPIYVVVRSFTSSKRERLWLDLTDVERLDGCDVWIVDDVITTGETLRAVETLVNRAHGNVTERFIVLKEGEQAAQYQNVSSLGELPIF